jgi:hypothetical protein
MRIYVDPDLAPFQTLLSHKKLNFYIVLYVGKIGHKNTY